MPIQRKKRARLEARGWRVGDASDFLELTPEETALIEMKLGLAYELRRRREAETLTQTQLAERLGTSQSRVAKMEAADGSVSLDLIIKALLVIGATRREVARAMARPPHRSRSAA